VTDDDLDAGSAHADTGAGGPSLLLLTMYGILALLIAVVGAVWLWRNATPIGPPPINPNIPLAN
jgi:hypothetical protein